MPLNVEVGGGRKPRKGYVNCDVRQLDGVDHVCTADDLPFADGEVQEVYTRHVVEHFTLKEFLTVLAEWNRVLQIGGRIHIVCPNLLFHLRQILDGSHESFYDKVPGRNDRYWGLGSLFGWQQDEYDVHKFGYYFELLTRRSRYQRGGLTGVSGGDEMEGTTTSCTVGSHAHGPIRLQNPRRDLVLRSHIDPGNATRHRVRRCDDAGVEQATHPHLRLHRVRAAAT